MDRDRIRELHYITDWKNIPSILEKGIVCHRAAQGISHESVANADVQARRAEVTVPGGRPLHHYACLYIDARNSMLYTLLGQPRLAVLAIDDAVIETAGVIVSDRNAASGVAGFRPAADGIAALEEMVVFAEWWNETRDAKQRRCAEVLVPTRVDATFIRKVYVADEKAAARLQSDLPDLTLPVEANRYLFYRGPRT